jgi:hypothetical protein
MSSEALSCPPFYSALHMRGNIRCSRALPLEPSGDTDSRRLRSTGRGSSLSIRSGQEGPHVFTQKSEGTAGLYQQWVMAHNRFHYGLRDQFSHSLKIPFLLKLCGAE